MSLTSKQLIELSTAIPVQELLKIAEGYLDLDHAVIRNIVFDYRHSEAITREMIRLWSYKNQTPDQVQASVKYLALRNKKCVVNLFGKCCEVT